MSQLLRMLDFIVLSVLQEKLSPKTMILLMQSANLWRLEDVDDIFSRKDKLYKEYLKAYLRIANSRKQLHSSRSENYAPYKLPTSYRSELIRRYQTFPLPPPIIRTSHPDAPGPFVTIPPLIPEGSPPVIPLLIPPLPIPPVLRQIDESILLLKEKFSSCSIPDKPRTKAKLSKRDTKSKSNSSISVSSCSNKVENYSALSYLTTASPVSHSASCSTPPSTDYSDDVVASTYYSETSDYDSQPSYTIAATISSASSDPASFPTPPPTHCTCGVVASTYYPDTSGYYSHPSYTTATTIAPAAYFVLTPTPSPIDYVANSVASTYYPDTSRYYLHPSYNNATIIASAPTPTPTPISYTSNEIATTYYPETSRYYSHPSYNSATTTASAPTPTPSQIDYVPNLVTPTCYPQTSPYLHPSDTVAATTFSPKQSK